MSHRWTDAQLSELDQHLAALDFVADYKRAMRAENSWQAASMDFLRHHRDQLHDLDYCGFDEEAPFRLPDIPVHLIPSGWFHQNQLRSSQFILGQILPIADVGQQTISCPSVKQADEALRTMPVTPYSNTCKMFLPGLAHSARKFALAQTTVNLARTACALERHRLAHGKYPETLDALAPQFITKVPHDPVDGQPLHYRLTDDGQFVLYSEGWNEKDDGGVVALAKSGSVDLDSGDWVWRYPDLPKPRAEEQDRGHSAAMCLMGADTCRMPTRTRGRPSGNTPTVADLRLVFLGANQNPNAALDQVAGLLMQMGMARQDSVLAHSKLGHQRLPLNPVQGQTVSCIASLLEHGC